VKSQIPNSLPAAGRQIPNKLQASMTKSPKRVCLEIGKLGFIWNLVLVIWDLFWMNSAD
jgi:hypothetical protein